MCGRFALTTNEAELVEEFSISGISNLIDPLPANWNIKPTEDIFIVRNCESQNYNDSQSGNSLSDSAVRELSFASWGIIAPWSKSDSDATKSQSNAINARSETIQEKPTFRRAITHSRCLIPASGYYEWATTLGTYKTKQPVYISRDDAKLLAFAGIYSRWLSPSGTVRESAAIITREAAGALAKVHNRMPLFIPNKDWNDWLSKSVTDTHQIRALMSVTDPDEHLRYWPVKNLVNSIRNNGPELIEKIDLGEPETLF